VQRLINRATDQQLLFHARQRKSTVNYEIQYTDSENAWASSKFAVERMRGRQPASSTFKNTVLASALDRGAPRNKYKPKKEEPKNRQKAGGNRQFG
jgi:hypothetical protein